MAALFITDGISGTSHSIIYVFTSLKKCVNDKGNVCHIHFRNTPVTRESGKLKRLKQI